MEITVATGLFAKRYVNVNARHRIFYAWIFVFVIFIQAKVVNAQDLVVEYDFTAKPESKVQLPNSPQPVKSLFDLQRNLNEVLFSLREQSYLASNIDTFYKVDSFNYKAIIFVGNKIEFNKLEIDSAAIKWFLKFGILPNEINDRKLSVEEVTYIIDELLNKAEEEGYPFASAYFRDFRSTSSDKLVARLIFDKGPLIRYGSIEIVGDGEVKESFLRKYLQFRQDEVYDERTIKKLDQRLRQLNFIKLNRPSSFIYARGKCNLRIYAEKRFSSSINGIIGILPNSDQTGGLLINGEADIALNNSFKRATQLGLHWEKSQLNNQELQLNFEYPYLFNSNLGLSGNLDLVKFDTLYLNVSRRIGLGYFFSGLNNVEFYYQRENQQILSRTYTGDLVDFNFNTYGINFSISRYDDRINPANAYYLDFSSSVSTKQFVENPNFSDADLEDVEKNSEIFQANLGVGKFWKLGSRWVLYNGFEGAAILDDQIFFNQLHRIGGLNDLRGFDDRSILASSYAVVTNEIRFVTDENSFIQLFSDISYIEQSLLNSFTSDWPFSFGAGYQFGVANGTFALIYAFGQSSNVPVNFRNGKIHFGYTNRF